MKNWAEKQDASEDVETACVQTFWKVDTSNNRT